MSTSIMHLMPSIHQKTFRKLLFEKFLKVRASSRFADNFRKVFWCMHQCQKTFRKFYANLVRARTFGKFLKLSKSFWNFQKLSESCFSISYTRKLSDIFCRNIFRQKMSESFLVYGQHNIIIICEIHMFYGEITDFDFSIIRAQVASLFNDVTLMTWQQ